MKVLILGATGNVGRWATRLAVAAGHEVTAFARPSTPADPPLTVRLERGSVLDVDHLRRAMADQQVVVSCIGAQRTNPLNPFSPIRPPLHVCEGSARAIVQAASDTGVTRVVAISAAGVADSAPAMNGAMQWLVRRSSIGAMYADLAAMEQVYRESALEWQAVRPVTLVSAGPSRRTHVVTRYRAASIVSRADVATWLVRVATSAAPIADRTPMIGWW